MKRIILLTTLVFCLSISQLFAAPGDVIWEKTYGGSNDDHGTYLAITPYGDFIICGSTASYGAGSRDFYLLKTDSNGDTIWTNTYGGSNYDNGFKVNNTVDGGYILTGWTESFGAGGRDVYVIKTNANGNTLWTQTFGGINEDRGNYAEQTSDGGYIISGMTKSFGAGNFDVYIIKTDANGNSQWTQTYGGSNQDYANCIHETTDGGYIAVGLTESYGMGGWDIYLLKLDSSGNTEWTQTYGGSGNDNSWSVVQTTDGGYIMGGYTNSFGHGMWDFYVIKVDNNGNVEWDNTYGTGNTESSMDIQQTQDGGYIIVGETQAGGSFDGYAIKLDSNGNQVWSQTYGGADYERILCVRQMADGNYIFAGNTGSYGAGGRDVYLLKVEGTGGLCCDISMVPDNFPVYVPAGGTFGIRGIIGNPTSGPITTDVWYGVVAFNTFFEQGVFRNLSLPAGVYPSAHLNQEVPSFAPAGEYVYSAWCGDYTTGTACDSFSFPFNVTSPLGSGGADQWLCYGGFDVESDVHVPTRTALMNNYPNPFNATTVIPFELSNASNVSLKVYNLTGQLVETLVDGYMNAGSHEVNWDASTVSSGVYFYTLETDDYTTTKKMNLLK